MGRRIRSEYLQVIYFTNPIKGSSPEKDIRNKFAVCISNKFGKSVERNKAKRILREIYRKIKYKINPGIHIAIIPTSRWLNLDFSRKESELLAVLKKAKLIQSNDEFSSNSTD
jgi:ribonuclease P protein component